MHRRQSFLIRDNGDVLLSAAAAGGRVLSASSSRATEEAVAGLGYVEWQPRLGHVRICISPAMTSPAAHERLMTWLFDTRPERALLVIRESGRWEYEYLRGTRGIAQRIDWLIAHAAGGNLIRRQIRSLVDPQLSTAARRAIEYWRSHRERFDPVAASAQLAPLLPSRLVLFENAGEPANYVLESFGPGFPGYFQSYLGRRKADERCGGSPERFYLRSNSLAYQAAEDRFEPCLDDVDALVHWPGHGRIRHRYTRLMLPFRAGKRHWVLSATSANPDVNLLD